MPVASKVAFGMLCTAATVLTRTATRRAMHRRGGAPRLPPATRHNKSVGMMLLLAAAAGALFALGDVMQEQRKHVTQTRLRLAERPT